MRQLWRRTMVSWVLPGCAGALPSAVLGAVLLLLLASVGCLSGRSVRTAAAERDYSVSPLAFEMLQRAQQALGEDDADKAYEALQRMREREDRFSEHERTLMWQLYAQMYADQGHYKEAAGCLQYALKLGALPQQALQDAGFDLGQLQLAGGQHTAAADTFSQWLREVEAPTAEARYLAAVALFEAQRFEPALAQISQAVAMQAAPAESWLQLQLAAQLQLERYADAEVSLLRLLEEHPKSTYWMQLAAVYGELQRYPQSLAAMEILERQGELTRAADLRRLARLYLQQRVPTKALSLFSRYQASGGLPRDAETLEILADALLMAHEREQALQVLQELSALVDHGRAELRLAYLYLDADQFEAASRAVRKALERGGLRARGQAYVLLGTIDAQLGRKVAARRAFELAAQDDATRAVAERWLADLSPAKHGQSRGEEKRSVAPDDGAGTTASSGTTTASGGP